MYFGVHLDFLRSGGNDELKKTKNMKELSYQIKNVSCSFEHLNDGSFKYYSLVLCRKIAIQCAIEVV